MKKQGLLLTVLLLTGAFITLEGLAQVPLQGRVTESVTNAPVAGANVGVQGTAAGTSTDNDGRFALTVDALPVQLTISFVGYETRTVNVTDDAFLNITLNEADVILEDMVVVGARFAPRTVITSPVPIDNIKAVELFATGQATFDKMLTYTVPAFNSSQQTISDATAHFDPADLRGLGPSRTLVLVNGKRKNPSALVYINDTPGKGEVGVDMKSIPAQAIDRIEVLRDGASAQYGSDAIAGVINIILKEDTGTTEVNGFSGITSEGDGFRIGYSADTGFEVGDGGFLHLTHTLYNQEETNRPGEPCTGNVDLNTCDGLFGGLLGLVQTDEHRAWLQDNPDLGMRVGMPKMFSADIYANLGLPLGAGTFTFYANGGVTYRDGKSYALYRTPYWIPDEFNLLHEPSSTYGGFQPTFETSILDLFGTAGINGLVSGWNFDLSNTFGQNTVDYTVAQSLNLALGDSSPTSFDPGGYDFLQNVINLDVARHVGIATVALGSEFRIENFGANAGGAASYEGNGAQSFPGLQPQNARDETRNNIGAYADVVLDLTSALLLGGAARFENYSDFGNSFTWKVNGRYLFGDELATIRASASTGFRAPSLHQFHLSIIQTLVSGGTVSNQGTFDNNSEILNRLQVPSLKEEEAFNLTAGVAVAPTPGLRFSVDAYQVDVDDRIVYSSSIATSDPSTEVFQILEEFQITSIKFFTNAVNTRTRGIDAVVNYTTPAGPGELGVNFAANFNDTEIQGQIATPAPIAAANVDIFDRKEQSRLTTGRPDSKLLLGLTYETGPLRAALNNTRFGEVTWQHATDPANDQTFSAKIITDLDVVYQVTDMIGLGLSVNNLFDVYPDEIDVKGDVLTNLGGRFRYPWEVNQFGFAGTMVTGNVKLTF